MGIQRISENTNRIPKNIGKQKWDSKEYRKTQMGFQRTPKDTDGDPKMIEKHFFHAYPRHMYNMACVEHSRVIVDNNVKVHQNHFVFVLDFVLGVDII